MRWIAIVVFVVVVMSGCSLNKVHVKAKAKSCGQTMSIEVVVK